MNDEIIETISQCTCKVGRFDPGCPYATRDKVQHHDKMKEIEKEKEIQDTYLGY